MHRFKLNKNCVGLDNNGTKVMLRFDLVNDRVGRGVVVIHSLPEIMFESRKRSRITKFACEEIWRVLIESKSWKRSNHSDDLCRRYCIIVVLNAIRI